MHVPLDLLKLGLLIRSQLVLYANRNRELSALHVSLDAQDLIELGERSLLVDDWRLGQVRHRFNLILHLPLQLAEPRRRLNQFVSDRGLLFVAEPDGLSVLHDEFRREQVLPDWVGSMCRRWLARLSRLRVRLLLRQAERGNKKNYRAQHDYF